MPVYFRLTQTVGHQNIKLSKHLSHTQANPHHTQYWRSQTSPHSINLILWISKPHHPPYQHKHCGFQNLTTPPIKVDFKTSPHPPTHILWMSKPHHTIYHPNIVDVKIICHHPTSISLVLKSSICPVLGFHFIKP